ncbi:hypothetical protein [uncultured Gilvimarinus sp.]|uniref:hypothetical protein n=1 Tax=uncultured Gilvimarinus sp. TaxID=1689143 RepID=UPI0030DD076D
MNTSAADHYHDDHIDPYARDGSEFVACPLTGLDQHTGISVAQWQAAHEALCEAVKPAITAIQHFVDAIAEAFDDAPEPKHVTYTAALISAAQKAQARRRYKAACRAVGIVNQLTPGPYRGYHASRVFTQKNTLRRAK